MQARNLHRDNLYLDNLHLDQMTDALRHTEVDFVLDHGTVTIVKSVAGKSGENRGDRLILALRGSATDNLDLTTDEIIDWSRTAQLPR